MYIRIIACSGNNQVVIIQYYAARNQQQYVCTYQLRKSSADYRNRSSLLLFFGYRKHNGGIAILSGKGLDIEQMYVLIGYAMNI